MGATYEDNIEQVLASYEDEMPSETRFTLVIANITEYAAALHDRAGYYVMNDEKTARAVYQWLEQLMDSGHPMSDENIRNALEGAGFEVINFLTSLTGEMRPPLRQETLVEFTTSEGEDVEFVAWEGVQGQPREAHPGGWADITRQLANGYQFVVDGRGVRNPTYSASASDDS